MNNGQNGVRNSNGRSIQIQWGSENRTCPDFEWLKVDRTANGPIFEWHSKTERFLPRPFEHRTFFGQTIRNPDIFDHSKTDDKNVRFSNVSDIWMFGFRIPTVLNSVVHVVPVFENKTPTISLLLQAQNSVQISLIVLI